MTDSNLTLVLVVKKKKKKKNMLHRFSNLSQALRHRIFFQPKSKETKKKKKKKKNERSLLKTIIQSHHSRSKI